MSTDHDTNRTDRPPVPPVPPIVSPGYMPQRTPDRPRRGRRRRLVALLVTAMVLLFPVAVVLYGAHDLNSNITRLDGLLPPAAGRPPHASGPAAEAVNVLVLGDDAGSGAPSSTRSPRNVADLGGVSVGSLMVLHIDADRRGVSVISIPPDAWVDVPGHGRATIGTASSWGGPSLVVGAFEKLAGVRIDHVAVIGWDGYKAMIDTLGGVDVTIPAAADANTSDRWTPGTHHMDGSDALLYVRERSDRAGGELQSVARRQEVLRGLSARAAAITSSPVTVYRLLESLTDHLAVDSGWGATAMAKLALSLRGLGASDVTYIRIPVAGTGRLSDKGVVSLDRDAGNALWAAVRDDRMSG